LLFALTAACPRGENPAETARATSTGADEAGPSTASLRIPPESRKALADPRYRRPRLDMVRQTMAARDITSTRVLEAMRHVPRHEFVPAEIRDSSYLDNPLPIGWDQTISQPYIVALMTQLVNPKPTDKVLEIGTGSGYQAAVLALLADQVYTIEIVKPLGERAAQDLKRLGYNNVRVRIGDGYRGWPEQAPFDCIVVTAAPPTVPKPLVEQLKVGGRMVIPVGPLFEQELRVLRKTDRGLVQERSIPVRFVPMIGEVEKQKENAR
jgi:protein-L-isoaspartate(D-aspartate) O-methyltransferase